MRTFGIAGLATLFLSCFIAVGQKNPAAPLRLDRQIELPAIHGGFDHFAFDESTEQLFLAASDQGVVEAIGFPDGQVRDVLGFTNPHSILVQPASSRILVTDSGPGASAFVDSKKLKVIRRLPLALGANCILDDPLRHRAYVTAGGDRVHLAESTLQSIDTDSGRIVASTSVSALHLQPMAFDASTSRLFVNMADQDTIAIFDGTTLRRLGTWKLPMGHKNSPIVLDLERHRLFVVATDPGILMQLDSNTGVLEASVTTPLTPDDISFDRATERIYVPGDGALAVFDASGSGSIRLLQQIETGPGARTGMLIDSKQRFVVAVPSSGANSPARIMVFVVVK